jgi:hypothetical protein
MLRSPNNNSNKDLWRYAGLTAQLFAALGIAVYIGLKADEWLFVSSSVLVWALPLLVIAFTIYKLIKETQKKK